jgi:tRNA(Ile)-lysidine synthase TilS/MesJ
MDTTKLKFSIGEENKIIRSILKKVGKALGDYKMIDNNDNILVGVSGGKDSLTLIDVLKEKQKKIPVKFNLFAVIVDFGFSNSPDCFKEVENYLKNIGVEYNVIKKPLPKSERRFNCFWCSWNRRKEIFLLAKKLNCRKVALGHNLDDIIVTFLMNLFYHGEISTMPAKLEIFKGEIVLIRPLVYLTSEETKVYSEVKNLPVVNYKCPYYDSNNIQRRHYILNIVNDLQKYYPNIKLNIFNSLKKIRKEYLV